MIVVFEFVDGTQEKVWQGSPRYRELIEDGHTPVGSVPESDGVSDALETYLDGRFGATTDASVAGLVGDSGSAVQAALRDRETVLNARDYGAVGDGATDDTAAIQAAINVGAANGARVILPGVNKAYVVSQISLGYRGCIEIPAGITIRRLAGSAETGPVVLANRNHGGISGKGTVEALNDCPDGVVRIERTDGACEWTRLNDIHIKGPGKTVVGSTGLVLSGTSTFQNRANGCIISDVASGCRNEGGANMNHFTDVDFYNIGSTIYDLDGTLESSIIGGSVSQAQNTTIFTLRNAATYNRIVGFLAEPGGTSFLWSVAAGCLNNQFIGVVDNVTNLGTDAGTRTTKIITSRSIFPSPTTTNPSIQLPHGTAPASPQNGDMWTTTAGLFVRINGATVGPLT